VHISPATYTLKILAIGVVGDPATWASNDIVAHRWNSLLCYIPATPDWNFSEMSQEFNRITIEFICLFFSSGWRVK